MKEDSPPGVAGDPDRLPSPHLKFYRLHLPPARPLVSHGDAGLKNAPTRASVMNRTPSCLLLGFCIISTSSAMSAPLRSLVFTEVVREVAILDPVSKKETPAKVGDALIPPNVLRTGVDSRAELKAPDETVTRVGSNTVFSFDASNRDIQLNKGSVLFHSPAGKGGGNIKTSGATASVLGTTL
ncbi:MAG: hypothetical protein RLZZ399_2009, partial [Verrucomicrobiota bacterium]